MRKPLPKKFMAILTAAVMAGMIWTAYRMLDKTYVFWNGSLFSRQTQRICVSGKKIDHPEIFLEFEDLRYLDARDTAMTVQQYEWLRQELPKCEVLWDVPIQGVSYSRQTEELHVEQLTDEEMMLLEYLPSLKLLDLGKWEDHARIQQLRQDYPEVTIISQINLAGKWFPADAVSLDLSGVAPDSIAQIEDKLSCFPELQQVTLNSYCLPQQDLIALAMAHPEIQFDFNLIFGDYILPTNAEQIDISNMALQSTAAVEEILPCFYNLKKVIMCECGLSSQEMDSLNRKYEDIRFVWSVWLAGKLFRTDAVHFTPNRWGLSCDNENISDLRYCTDMVCVDIGHQVKVTDCEFVKNMPDLKYLILAETGISDLSPLENHENLIYLELFLSKVKDYSALTTCKALEDLNLCYTQGDPTPIGEMTWLKRLWWSGCWAGRKYLEDKLPDTDKEYFSLSSTGRGWREGQHYYDMRDFIGMEYMVG